MSNWTQRGVDREDGTECPAYGGRQRAFQPERGPCSEATWNSVAGGEGMRHGERGGWEGQERP